ncbi:MAG: hypothetical protein WCF85_17810, partial [Rhodospirillaceae bacterium]
MSLITSGMRSVMVAAIVMTSGCIKTGGQQSLDNLFSPLGNLIGPSECNGGDNESSCAQKIAYKIGAEVGVKNVGGTRFYDDGVRAKTTTIDDIEKYVENLRTSNSAVSLLSIIKKGMNAFKSSNGKRITIYASMEEDKLDLRVSYGVGFNSVYLILTGTGYDHVNPVLPMCKTHSGTIKGNVSVSKLGFDSNDKCFYSGNGVQEATYKYYTCDVSRLLAVFKNLVEFFSGNGFDVEQKFLVKSNKGTSQSVYDVSTAPAVTELRVEVGSRRDVSDNTTGQFCVPKNTNPPPSSSSGSGSRYVCTVWCVLPSGSDNRRATAVTVLTNGQSSAKAAEIDILNGGEGEKACHAMK